MSRSFDGTDDYINFGTAVGPSGGFTCAMWMRTTTVGAGAGMFASMYDAPANKAYFQFFRGTAGCTARIHTDLDTNRIGRTVAGIFAANIWYFVAFTWSGGTTNSAIKIYKNAVQVDSTDDGAGTFTGSNANSITGYLGVQVVAGPSFGADFSGLQSHVQMFTRALSINEISQIMMFPGSISNGLWRYYPLWGETVESDYSGNKFNGTITGATHSKNNPPINGVFQVPQPGLTMAF